MMLKPTFPSPYLTSVDADSPVVMSCVVNERNHIEGYDLCIENSYYEYHVIGFARASENNLMHKFWYSIDKHQEKVKQSLTKMDNNNTSGGNKSWYAPDTSFNETKLPITPTNATLLSVVLPTKTETVEIKGKMTGKYTIELLDPSQMKYLNKGDEISFTWSDGTTTTTYTPTISGIGLREIDLSYSDVVPSTFSNVVNKDNLTLKTVSATKSILYNGGEFKWNIRLLGKGDLVSWGTWKNASTTYDYIGKFSDKNWTHAMTSPSGLYPTGYCILQGDISTNFEFSYSNNPDMLKIHEIKGYISIEKDATYNYIIFEGTEPTRMAQSPQYYFKTANPPRAIVSENYIGMPLPGRKTVSAEYITFANSALHHWNVLLYDKFGNLIEDSGNKYSSSIYYTFNNVLPYGGFRTEDEYTIQLNCIFDTGSEASAKKGISSPYFCSGETLGLTKPYNVSTTHYLNVDTQNGYFNIDLSQATNWLGGQIFDSIAYGWTLLRKEINTGDISCVGFFERSDIVSDFNVKNKSAEYEYLICLGSINENNLYEDAFDIATSTPRQFKTKTPVSLSWNGWILYDLIPGDEENAYTIDKDNVWYFNVGIKNGTFTPKYSKVFEYGFGKYPKGYSGKGNALTGSFSCNIGSVSCSNSEYVGDDIYALKRWQDFCANGHMKLLKSPKGHVIPCGIVDTSYDVNNSPSQETQISFNYTQLEDEDKISVYEVE